MDRKWLFWSGWASSIGKLGIEFHSSLWLSFSYDILVQIVRMFENVHQTSASFDFVEQTRLNMTSASFLTFLYEVSEVVYPPGIERTEGGAWNYSHEDAIDWDHLQKDLKHYTGDLEIEKHREIEEMDRALEVTSINREEGMLKIGKLKSENDRTEMECMSQFWESALQPEVNMQPKGASKSCGSCDALSEACCEWIATRQSHLSYGGLVGESSSES